MSLRFLFCLLLGGRVTQVLLYGVQQKVEQDDQNVAHSSNV